MSGSLSPSIKLILFMFVFICSVVLYIVFFSPIIYAMEPELHEQFMSKIASVKDNIEHFKCEASASEHEFKKMIDYMSGVDEKDSRREYLTKKLEEMRQNMKESQTNLSSERRMLNILENKRRMGDYTLPSSSTVSKRPFQEEQQD